MGMQYRISGRADAAQIWPKMSDPAMIAPYICPQQVPTVPIYTPDDPYMMSIPPGVYYRLVTRGASPSGGSGSHPYVVPYQGDFLDGLLIHLRRKKY